MPYLGNEPGAITDAFTQSFTGDASTTAFTLSQASTTNSVFVRVHGVMQRNGTDFDVDGVTLTFTTAPPAGTNNIVVQFFTVGSVQEIAADAVTGAKIADNAIDSEHYTDGSIDTAHIADNQITLAKLAGGTDGNIISFDASGDPVAIATGSSGQVLTSGGAGAAPAFAAAAGGGTKVLARAAFSNASAVSITAFDNTNYDAYKIFWEITPATDGVDIIYKTSTNGGSAYDGGSGHYYWRHFINDPGIEDFTVTSTTEARTTRGASNGGFLASAGTGEHAVGELTIIAPDNTGYTFFSGIHTGFHTNALLMYSYLHAARLSAADVDALQITASSGNVTGRYVLLGINNST